MQVASSEAQWSRLPTTPFEPLDEMMYGYAGSILGGPVVLSSDYPLELQDEMMYGYAGSILGSPVVLSSNYST